MNRRAYVINICCLLAGGLLGVALSHGFWMRSDSKTAAAHRQTQGAGKTAAARVAAQEGDGSDGGRSVVDGLVTQDDFRGFLQRWVDADCPADASDDAEECVRRWAKIDPRAALAFVSEAAKFRDRNDSYVIALSEMGKNDIHGVVAWINSNLAKDDAESIARDVMRNLIENAPAQAGEFLLSGLIPDSGGYQSAAILRILMRKSPQEALSLFERFTDNNKERDVEVLVDEWARGNWKAAADWCEQQQGKPYAKLAIRSLISRVAFKNPEQAAGLIERFGVDLGQNGNLIGVIAYGDPLVAMDLLKKIAPENRNPTAVENIVRQLFSENPEYGLQAARALYPENELPYVMARSYSQWINSDRKAAEAWLAALPDADLKSKIQTMQTAKENPSAFLAAMDANETAKGEWKSTVGMALDDVLGEQPEAGFDWMLRNPEYIDDYRIKRALDASGGEIGLEKIEAMPEGAARDTVLLSSATYWAGHGQFEQAESALPSIENPQAQTALRFKIFSEMAKNSIRSREASQWLASQPVSQEVRESWEAIANSEPVDDRVVLPIVDVFPR